MLQYMSDHKRVTKILNIIPKDVEGNQSIPTRREHTQTWKEH